MKTEGSDTATPPATDSTAGQESPADKSATVGLLCSLTRWRFPPELSFKQALRQPRCTQSSPCAAYPLLGTLIKNLALVLFRIHAAPECK